MDFKVTDFAERENNTLRGFIILSIYDPNSSLEIEIFGFMLHQKGKQRWIEFPTKKDKNGKYSDVIGVNNKESERILKTRILKELDKYLDKIKSDDLYTF